MLADFADCPPAYPHQLSAENRALRADGMKGGLGVSM